MSRARGARCGPCPRSWRSRSAACRCVLLVLSAAGAGGADAPADVPPPPLAAIDACRTDGDILKNLTVKWTSGLVPPALAHALIYAIVLCNTCNLLVNFVLKARPTTGLGALALTAAGQMMAVGASRRAQGLWG